MKETENLVVKQINSADGAILYPTQVFVDPCPPHISAKGDGTDEPDMHERDLEDMKKGMKLKNTPEVTGSDFYKAKAGDPRWY